MSVWRCRRHGCFGLLLAAFIAMNGCNEIHCQPPDNIQTVDIQLSTKRVLHKIPEAFLGFTIDWNDNTLDPSWAGAALVVLDFNNARLRQLSSALAPAVLRVGGSLADEAVYDVGHPPPEDCPKKTCLTMERWAELVKFAQDTGLHLLFDLNVMRGRVAQNGSYIGDFDVSNIKSLLEYTKSLDLKVWGFELGNEKEHDLTPQQVAGALLQVGALIDDMWPHAPTRPKLIGPAMNPRPDWLEEMLLAGGAEALDGVTVHSYPGYGLNKNLVQVLSQPSWIDFPRVINEQHLQAIRNSGTHIPMYVGETAMAWASGQGGMCDTFASGFWWINALAGSASSGVKGVFRQTVTGGNYGLLDVQNGFAPRPDYWTALLLRKLTSTRWLAIAQLMPGYDPGYTPDLRVYASCTPGIRVGAVTIIYSNQNPTQSYRLAFGLAPPVLPIPVVPREEYFVTAPDNDVHSKSVLLNGIALSLSDDGGIPPLEPKVVASDATRGVLVPALSYGFFVLLDAQAQACMKAEADMPGPTKHAHKYEHAARPEAVS